MISSLETHDPREREGGSTKVGARIQTRMWEDTGIDLTLSRILVEIHLVRSRPIYSVSFHGTASCHRTCPQYRASMAFAVADAL